MPVRAATDRPNIILINCDDLGYGDLGCYGSTVNQTPVLDSLARQGTRFTDFYMASSVCSPSRGAMMTGCYPRRIGFGTFDNDHWVLFPGHSTGLSTNEVTVARLLRDQGYATKIVGKWHCGDQPEFLPTRHGFDSYYGIPYSNDMGRQSGREHQMPPLPLVREEEVIEEQPDQVGLTERYVEECVRFIRGHAETPFFLYLAHMYVHLPIYAPERFMRQSQNGRYGAGVECVDWSTGVLVRELRRLGLAENTLIVFTSDNGSRARGEGGSNGPLNGTKGTSWDGGHRVPCIAYWPGVVPGGRVSDELVTSMDFLPTFAALAGTAAPDDRPIDGADLSALFRGEDGAASPHEAYYYYFKNDLAAVRSGDWKLHVARGNEPVRELYNLRDDLGEQHNLFDQHGAEVKRIEALLDRMRDDIGDHRVQADGANCRPVGRVEKAAPMTTYDPDYPYYMAEYDLGDAG